MILRAFRPVFVMLAVQIFFGRAYPQVTVKPDHPGGIYRTGETVTWMIEPSGDRQLDSLRYRIRPGGLEVSQEGMLDADRIPATVQYTFGSPGSVLLEVRWGQEKGFKNRSVGGALADPDRFRLSAMRPEDFKEFWGRKLNELEQVPVNPVLEEGESGKEGVAYYTITMDNIRGSRIRGQLARPEGAGKFPAMLIVQWAGVYPLDKNWVVGRAGDGWLVLDINAHDLPIAEDRAFYRDQSAGPLRNYWAIGNDDRETSYFLRMYLSCYRAAEYLANREDWNGNTLVVTGGSQGGQQALVTAGLYPGITACMALVPAGFDMLGPEMGRKGGWPQWYSATEGKDPERVHEASRYFDVANFIPDIRCPVLAGVGLLDETCPPEGILAGLNQLTSSKEVVILPESGHANRNGSQSIFFKREEEVWLPALKSGKLPPGL